METNLQDFIKKTIEEITLGLPDGYVVEDSINFEVSVTSNKSKSGGIEIKVVSGGIQKGNELVQTVSFSIINELDKAKSDKKTGDNILRYIDKVLKKLTKLSLQNNTFQLTNYNPDLESIKDQLILYCTLQLNIVNEVSSVVFSGTLCISKTLSDLS
jgi:hypothetical protein